MNEEIEYAEMLEIPISTVNVVRKTDRRRKKKTPCAPQEMAENSPLKESVIDRINERMEGEDTREVSVEADLFAESANSQGELKFDPIPRSMQKGRAEARPFS